ncbi:MAG TPA: hypothetical protein DC049_07310, partial [Spirochaetia bacterium]|nr:hypothetical protein [Spirochaetia bacterium]
MDKSRLDFFPPIIIFFLIFLYGRFLAADFPEIWETLRAYLPEEMQAETENSGENEIYLELEKLFLRKIDINKESHMLADLFFLDSALAGKTTQAARIRPFKTL